MLKFVLSYSLFGCFDSFLLVLSSSNALQNHEQIDQKSKVIISDGQKIEYAKYIIKHLRPFLEQINTEQAMERELEAKIQGFPFHPILIS